MADLSTSGTLTIASGVNTLATSATIGSVLIYNETGNDTIYVGDANVTTSNGIPVAAGQSMSIDIGDLGSVYLRGTTSNVVRYFATDRARP